jgi:hypothetical protein
VSAWGSQLSPAFFLDVAKGLVPGHTGVTILGHNDSQSAVSGFVDVAHTGDLTYLTAAETMEIASDDGADAAGGLGAQTVLVQGVDGNGAEISETVIMNGATDVTTVLSYLRVNFIIGLAVGATGWNVGTITATATTAATVQAVMGPTESCSQDSHYTVPAGQTLYILGAELNSSKTGGGSPLITFNAYARLGGPGNAWRQLFDKRIDTATSTSLEVVTPITFPFPERTDFRFRSDTDKDDTDIRTRTYGMLVAS